MMDDRILQEASLLVEHSNNISSGDDVVVIGSGAVEKLEAAVCRKIGNEGGVPILLHGGNFLTGINKSLAAYLSAAEDIQYSDLTINLLSEADAIIHLQGYNNQSEFADLADQTVVTHRKEYKQVFNTALFSTQYTLAQFPTRAGAQLAEMSPEEFTELIWDAILLDWEAQRKRQEPVVDALSKGSTVRVIANNGTDLRFDIDDMDAVNDYGQINLPGGEVYTAPVLDSVEGTVQFDLPVLIDGRELTEVYAKFKSGRLVELESNENSEFIEYLLNIDDGAGQLGEFGIGMNPVLTQSTCNMALDEKMAGTIHFAFGTAYNACVGKSNTRNESAIHIDLLVDMREESRIEVDGEVIQRDGEFLLD